MAALQSLRRAGRWLRRMYDVPAVLLPRHVDLVARLADDEECDGGEDDEADDEFPHGLSLLGVVRCSEKRLHAAHRLA